MEEEGKINSSCISKNGTPFLCLNSEIEDNSVMKPQPLTSFMECTVCFDLPTPIYQCSNGHIICQTCWGRLSEIKQCPSCRVSLAEPTRNLALEKILESYGVKIPCKFWGKGCRSHLTCDQKADHEKMCPFKTYACPAHHLCYWEGYLEELVEHLRGPNRSDHSLPVVYGDSASISFTIDWGINHEEVGNEYFPDLRLLAHMGQFFVIAFYAKRGNTADEGEPSNVEYSAVVQYIGKPERAEKFAYRMELECEGKRCSWEARPLDVTQSITSAMEKGDCFSFDSKKVALFATGEVGRVMIEVTVSEN